MPSIVSDDGLIIDNELAGDSALSKVTFEELVGQRLVIGVEGKSAAKEMVELFRATHAGGLILFERNFESPEQIRRLITDLEHSLKRRLLVFLDHEGGRVIRFKSGVTAFPDAETVGASGRPEEARRQGEIEAEELRSLKIDVNLAPVLDVLGSERNPAIETRSYGRDPEVVGEMGRARIEGMQSKGLWATAKHFPGIGEAVKDPHLELPVISKDWKALFKFDLIPFVKAFQANVACTMSSHVVYSGIEASKPATFSRKIMHEYLRLELGYRGVVLTDDLKMGAISKNVPLREAVTHAAGAGHDLLLICSDETSQREAFSALLWAYKKKDLKLSELEESVERVSSLAADFQL